MNEKNFSNDNIIDRNLGDEWADWVGDLSKYEKEINEGKRLFLSFYFLSICLLTIFAVLIYFFISPRLYQISFILGKLIKYSLILFFLFVYLFSFLLILTITTNKNFLFFSKKSGLHLEILYPLIYKIGNIFKISKDRIGNSLVKVNNALIYATKKKFKSENLLVLLPRCLDKETRIKVVEIIKKYNCKSFVATGGSSARKMVKKEKPDAIIGVACERDLVAGMADSPPQIPIIAIPNKRPQGPCKNTFIDVDELERAIKFLLKK